MPANVHAFLAIAAASSRLALREGKHHIARLLYTSCSVRALCELFVGRVRPESARWDEARRNIGVVQRVKLRPEHVAFEAHGANACLLFLTRLRIRHHIGQHEFRIARGLCQPAFEIGHHKIIDEIIILKHADDALAMDRRREELGERGGDCDDERLFAHEAHIGFDDVPRRRQRTTHRYDIFAVESETVGKDEPPFDPSGFGRPSWS